MQTRIDYKKRFHKKTILLFVILLPFLFPRGFSEFFPWYKNVQRYLLAFATVIIFFNFLISLSRKRIKLNFAINWVLVYHGVLLLITLCIQGGVTEGIQKIFFAPVFFILCMEQIKLNWKYFLNVFSTMLIMLFTLNITIFNQWMFPNFFLVSKHITFIGHVQIISQIGILSIIIGSIMIDEKKKKSILLITLGVLNMLYSMTLVSYIALFFLAIGIMLIKKTKIRLFKKPIIIYWIPQAVSVGLIALTKALRGFYFINEIDVSMGGRMFIWAAVLEKLKGHWLFGYGAFGVLFRVFWNDWGGNYYGSNYAHSEILQLLLDGGLVLLIVYVFMMMSCMNKMSKCKNCKEKNIAILLLGIFSVISIIESVTEYYYYFGFLAITASLELILHDKETSLSAGK